MFCWTTCVTNNNTEDSNLAFLLEDDHFTTEPLHVVIIMVLFNFNKICWFCLQGGIHGKISLTAYVVAALLETGITTEVRSPKS